MFVLYSVACGALPLMAHPHRWAPKHSGIRGVSLL
jgi:hypothetical protein